ncbi:MAG: beta-ketoacyl reductase, partial [Planctomycetes bacterium]|nr:beta-ketoacyl reductase [Planctomycetota bacterium]
EKQAAASAPAAAARSKLAKDASYLVVGGARGFGLSAAEHLLSRGAGHVLLMSRSGMAAESANAVPRKHGRITCIQADVTDFDAMRLSLVSVLERLPPLRGIVHAATVYHDALLGAMTPEIIEAVLAPKIAGAWNLHRYAAEHQLDFFVLFSSVAASIGNPGQIAYVAANQALETIAAYRRNMGLPGTAIAWGPVSDVGVLARRPDMRKALNRVLGNGVFTADEYLELLPETAGAAGSSVTVANLSSTGSGWLPIFQTPLFSRLPLSKETQAFSTRLVDIDGLPPDKALSKLVSFVTERVASVTRIPPRRLNPDGHLADIGMDSLAMVELYAELERAVDSALPADMLNDSVT